MHRWLVRIMRVIDVRFFYAFTRIFVLPPTLLVNGNGRRSAYSFARRRLGLNRRKSARMVWRNFCAFSEVVIDRFYMYAGHKFDIEIDGFGHFDRLQRQPSAFVQLSSHIGNYELAGYSLVSELKRINALVFAGEKETVMANRSKLFGRGNIRMVPMRQDMSHIFTLNEAIDNGEIVSMPADRVFGSAKAYKVPLFGADARIPQGPFLLAAAKRTPMLFVAVMKAGRKKYRITVRELTAPIEMPPRKRAEALVREYAGLLEQTVRQYPEQWYNYFNLWTDD